MVTENVKTLVEMGVSVHEMLFNDLVMEQRPDVAKNYIYLDACGFYGKQERRAARAAGKEAALAPKREALRQHLEVVIGGERV